MFIFIKLERANDIFLPIIFSFINGSQLFKLSNISFFSLLIVISYVLFCYFFIKSIINYHNPGIVSALLRTQIALTFFIMVVIFKSSFDIKKFIFICLILVGSVVTIIDPKKIGNNHESFVENKSKIKLNKLLIKKKTMNNIYGLFI